MKDVIKKLRTVMSNENLYNQVNTLKQNTEALKISKCKMFMHIEN